MIGFFFIALNLLHGLGPLSKVQQKKRWRLVELTWTGTLSMLLLLFIARFASNMENELEVSFQQPAKVESCDTKGAFVRILVLFATLSALLAAASPASADVQAEPVPSRTASFSMF